MSLLFQQFGNIIPQMAEFTLHLFRKHKYTPLPRQSDLRNRNGNVFLSGKVLSRAFLQITTGMFFGALTITAIYHKV